MKKYIYWINFSSYIIWKEWGRENYLLQSLQRWIIRCISINMIMQIKKKEETPINYYLSNSLSLSKTKS